MVGGKTISGNVPMVGNLSGGNKGISNDETESLEEPDNINVTINLSELDNNGVFTPQTLVHTATTRVNGVDLKIQEPWPVHRVFFQDLVFA